MIPIWDKMHFIIRSDDEWLTAVSRIRQPTKTEMIPLCCSDSGKHNSVFSLNNYYYNYNYNFNFNYTVERQVFQCSSTNLVIQKLHFLQNDTTS